jgi:hypothetical protein
VLDRDEMQAWLSKGQDYPGSTGTADRAVRMLERAKQSLAELGPGTMFDTEPAQIFATMEELGDD